MGLALPGEALATFALAMTGWVFFRAANLPQSVQVLHEMFRGARGHLLLANWHLELMGLALLLAVVEERFDWFERLLKAPMLAYASALALLFFCIEIFGVIDAGIPFVYFQF